MPIIPNVLCLIRVLMAWLQKTLCTICTSCPAAAVIAVGGGAAAVILSDENRGDTSHVHTYVEEVQQAATCTEEGYTTYTCHCGDSYVDDEVPATGHTWEDTGIIPPGCEGNGWTTYVCPLCGKTKTVQKEPVYDADGNGAVDQAGLTLLMSVLVGNTEAEVLYDFDFDGKLTIYDCVLLMQQIS